MFQLREAYVPPIVRPRHAPMRSSRVRVGGDWSDAIFTVVPYDTEQEEYALVPRDFAELEAVGALPEVPSGEKFIDPWWRCVRAAEAGGVGGPEWENTAAYLTDVPRTKAGWFATDSVVSDTAVARVAAMRAKIDGLAGSPIGEGVQALDQQSRDSLVNIATDLYTSYRTADGRADLARRIGVPIDEINKKKDVVLEIMSRPEFETVKSSLAPLYAALLPFRDQIMKGISAAASSIAGGGVSGLSGFSGAIPVIGAFVGFFINAYQAGQAELDEDAARRCGLAGQRLKDAVETLAFKRYPLPWHTERISSLDDLRCRGVDERDFNNEARRRLEAVAGLMEEWTLEFDRLPIPLKASIKQWWAITTTLMSSDKILPVFNALGSDPWGGRMATDEQVMLVAAPIAVLNGWDVDSFAAKLWDRSRGYAAIVDSSPNYLWKAMLKQWGDVGSRAICGALIRNAFFANLAVLAYDALNLAEEIKSETASSILFASKEYLALPQDRGFTISPEFITSQSSSLPILGLGAVASGGLYLAGMSLGVVAAPITLAILYWAVKR